MPGAPTLLRNVIGYGLVADRPAAAIEGRLYYATDEEIWYRDNATTWDAIAYGVSSVDGQSGIVDLSTVYAPIVHATSHAAAGSDPVTPDAIGAEKAGTGIAMAIVFGG